MKKILFISQYLNRNGTEAFMMNVFRSIDRGRFAIDFLLFSHEETDYSHEVQEAGCKVYRVPCRKESMLRWHTSLDKFFKEHAHEYTAIHFCGNSLTAMAPICYAYKYGIPVRVVHAHNSSARGLHNRLLHLMKRDLVRRISTHHFACSTLAAKWFFTDHPAVIIKNGIDVRKFEYNETVRQQKRKELGIGTSTKVIGHVGRFVPEKNHDFILDIFAAYSKSEPNSKLVLVGISPLMDNARAKAHALGIADKVMFLGERRDVNELMQAMDIFLMPSLFEGLPFVLIEAQCTGLPCVISDVINQDIAITNQVTFLPLQAATAEWTRHIEKSLSEVKDRTVGGHEVKETGYYIKDTIDYLETVYAQEK